MIVGLLRRVDHLRRAAHQHAGGASALAAAGPGIATADAVLDDAVRLGADKATLEVRRSNEGARKLYERFGFEVGGVRKEYYRQPVEDALILWRDRPPFIPGRGHPGEPGTAIA